MMHHTQAEQPSGMIAEDAPVGGDQQQPRSSESGEQAQYAKIPDFTGVDSDEVGGALREHKRDQYTERGDCAVRRDHKRSDMEENGMHQRQDM
jgi:hypothetical protein